MKKCIMACLFTWTGMTGFVCAQDKGGIIFPARSSSDRVFGIIDIEWPRHHFDILLKNGNTVNVRVSDKDVLDRLMNIDSLIKSVWKDLSFLKDSLQNEVTHKRIDYLIDQPVRSKIRFFESRRRGQTFVIDKNEPKVLKIEQDTLIILEQQTQPASDLMSRNNVFMQRPYKITLLLNDINQLESLLDGSLNNAILEIKKKWDALNLKNRDKFRYTFSSFYNAVDPSLSRPVKAYHDNNKTALEAYAQFGIQNINNKFVPSTGVGFTIVYKASTSWERRYQFIWEPYFLFDEQTGGKFRMRRNDFVSFQYLIVNNTRALGEKITLSQQFSVGYLVHRSGNFFRETTFKAGLPGANFKSLKLHPEFIFNGLFKNFQPGLKLYFHMN